MAYDEALDARVSAIVTAWGTTRKAMFGGTGYMLHGNMLAGVLGDEVVLRLDPVEGAEALEDPDVRPFDMTPHPMRGWVMVGPEGVEGEDLLRRLEQARRFVETLPPKR